MRTRGRPKASSKGSKRNAWLPAVRVSDIELALAKEAARKQEMTLAEYQIKAIIAAKDKDDGGRKLMDAFEIGIRHMKENSQLRQFLYEHTGDSNWLTWNLGHITRKELYSQPSMPESPIAKEMRKRAAKLKSSALGLGIGDISYQSKTKH